MAVLNKQPNATEYLERLILGKDTPPVPWLELEYRIDKILEEIKITPRLEPVISEDTPLILERACCKLPDPCKHWIPNQIEEVYINALTGERREYVQ